MTVPNWSLGLFKIGDPVTWTSQAGRKVTTKEGTVIETVAAGDRPLTHKEMGLIGRDHESYVVRVSRTSKDAFRRGKTYWPLVKNLRRKFEVFNEQVLRDEIVRIWGPAGAHIDVYDMLLKKAGLAPGAGVEPATT